MRLRGATAELAVNRLDSTGEIIDVFYFLDIYGVPST